MNCEICGLIRGSKHCTCDSEDVWKKIKDHCSMCGRAVTNRATETPLERYIRIGNLCETHSRMTLWEEEYNLKINKRRNRPFRGGLSL